MHPFHHYHNYLWHRRPSRLLWFAIGAVSATWWIKSRHADTFNNRYYNHCIRAKVHPTPPYPTQTPNQSFVPPQDTYQSTSATPTDQTVPSPPNTLPWTFSQQRQAQEWEAEKARLTEMSRQAGDKVAELSEATLDNLLTTVETLKGKLAEHRAERERQRKLEQQMLEEQKNRPTRWV